MKRVLLAFTIGMVVDFTLRVWVGGSVMAAMYYGFDPPVMIIFSIAGIIIALIAGGIAGYIAKVWGWLLGALIYPLRCIILFPLGPLIMVLISRAIGLDLDPRSMVLDIPRSLGNLGITIFCGALGGLIGEWLSQRSAEYYIDHPSQLGRDEEPTLHESPGFLKWYWQLSPSALVKIPVFLFFTGLTLASIAFDFGNFLRVFLWDMSLGAAVYWFSLLLIPAPLAAFYEIWSPRHRITKSMRYGLTLFVIPAWLIAHLLLIAIGGILGHGGTQ